MNSYISIENKSIEIQIAKNSSILIIYFDEEDQMYKVVDMEVILHSSPFLEGALKWVLIHY